MHSLFFIFLSVTTCVVQSHRFSLNRKNDDWYSVYKYSPEGLDIVNRALKTYERQKRTKVLSYNVIYIYAKDVPGGKHYSIALDLTECRNKKHHTGSEPRCEILTFSCVFTIQVTSSSFYMGRNCVQKFSETIANFNELHA